MRLLMENYLFLLVIVDLLITLFPACPATMSSSVLQGKEKLLIFKIYIIIYQKKCHFTDKELLYKH